MQFIKIIFPFILVIIIGIISFNAYNKAKAIDNNPLSVIPSHSSVILKINEPYETFSLFNKKKIWNKLTNIVQINKLNDGLLKINNFYKDQQLDNEHSLYISFLKDGVSSSGFLISSELSEESIQKIKNTFNFESLESFKYDNIDIYNITIDSTDMFITNISNIICLSSSKTIIEDAIKAFNSEYNFVNNDRFLNIYNTINNSSDINIIYNLNNLLKTTKSNALHDIKLLNNMSDWVASDMRIKDEIIILNGFNLINYKLSEYSDILNNQGSENINIIKLIPENINYLFSIGFNNIKQLYKNNNKLLENNNKIWEVEKYKSKIQNEYKFDYDEFINHIDKEAGIFSCGSIKKEENQYTYFKSRESIHAYSLIQRLINPLQSSTYLNKEINYILDNKLTSNIFGERFDFPNQNFFVVIDDFFIFSQSASNLEYIIDNYISGNTLNNNRNFTRFKQNISDKSNAFFYINPVKLFERISSNYETSLDIDSLNNFTGLSYQITNNSSYQINNLSLSYDEDFKESIKEKWFVQLDTITNMRPQIIYNHSLKENVVVIQDLAKKLYYFTNKKQFRWTKNLNELIIGNISQGDFFRNNKNQMLFNSSKNIYMLDRYGRDVERFPLKIKGSTKVQHSLFDYNKSKRYRIMIPKNDNSIQNFDSKGKKVIGWKYSDNNTINQQLSHYKYKDKDYIINSSEKELNLLAINGKSRLKFLSDSKLHSINNIAIDNNGNLLTVNSENKLFICHLDGTSNTITIPSLDSSSLIEHDNNNQHLLFSNKNKLFILDNNYNEIDSKSFNDDIQNIEIFKKYTVVQTKEEIYLFNDNKIVDGTPLKCDGTFSIANLSEDSKINILLTRKKILYNYELEEIR